jgi:catechol 2,3-dioxygenase-like lactoylglutathione lyase family enzyme
MRRQGIVAVTGPDFISLQVRDLERSAAFYEQYLGLKRSAAGPDNAGTVPRELGAA